MAGPDNEPRPVRRHESQSSRVDRVRQRPHRRRHDARDERPSRPFGHHQADEEDPGPDRRDAEHGAIGRERHRRLDERDRERDEHLERQAEHGKRGGQNQLVPERRDESGGRERDGERDEPDDRIGVHPAEIRLRDLLERDDDQDERRDRQEESREGRRRLPLDSRRCVVQAGRLVRRDACPAERLRLVHSR